MRVVSVLQVTEGGADACALMMTDSGATTLAGTAGRTQGDRAGRRYAGGYRADPRSPGDVLLTEVQQHGIDHIVIGHTARGALARWLLGSVSGDVLGVRMCR